MYYILINKSMKRIALSLIAIISVLNVYSFKSEIKTIKLNDGVKISARLAIPDTSNVKIDRIIFCIHGTGPNTYLTKRANFNYYDEVAKGFSDEGLALFTYNRRGCTDGNTPPFYTDVDSLKYSKYTPLQEAKDVECMIKSVLKDKRFKNCKVILYGISEGTIIAPLIAERNKVRVDALLLHGYANENMYDIIQWQNEGSSTMMSLNQKFDKNGDLAISRAEYEDKDEKISKYRKVYFNDVVFDTFDVNKDSVIDAKDIKMLRAPFHTELLKRVKANDWMWIRTKYFNVTPQWFTTHYELEANKSRLLRLDIPINIFHGTNDANVPVEGVYDIQKRFDLCNKSNLTIHIFENHDHDLNFMDILIKKEWSEGYKKLFKTAKNL